MKTSLKKLVAIASLMALVTLNSASATQIGTGTITGGATTPINSTWDGTGNPAGTSASGSLNVLVSAQVVPTLSMTVSTGALDFGVLAIGANSKSLTLTTATNAKDGVVVSVDSTGLATGNAATDKFIGALGRGSAVATTGTDTYTIDSTTSAGGTALSNTAVWASQTVLNANTVAKANATTTVNLTANIDAQTEAGNYNDTLTFTVTGSF